MRGLKERITDLQRRVESGRAKRELTEASRIPLLTGGKIVYRVFAPGDHTGRVVTANGVDPERLKDLSGKEIEEQVKRHFQNDQTWTQIREIISSAPKGTRVEIDILDSDERIVESATAFKQKNT